MKKHLKTAARFWQRTWRKSLLFVVTAAGMASMGWFKIEASKEAGLAFMALVLFTEIAAGVTVFAQALLRRVNTEAADQAFKFSIIARIVMACIGVALFVEMGHWQKDATGNWMAPYWLPGTVSVTAFLTYEVGNFIMIVIEWMFSHLLAHEDRDARSVLQREKKKRKKLAAKVEANTATISMLSDSIADAWAELGKLKPAARPDADVLSETIRAITTAVEETRAHMAHALGLNETDMEPHQAGVEHLPDIARDISEALRLARKENERARGVVKAIHGAVQGKHAPDTAVDDSETGDALRLVYNASLSAKMVEEMKGKCFTIAPNRQAFYCKSCGARNEKGRTAAPVCKSCGTNQNT